MFATHPEEKRPRASFVKVTAYKRLWKGRWNVHTHLSLPTSGFIEKFYTEKGAHSYASLHPCLDLMQSFSDTGISDI